jgi:hypothetical protein
MAASSVLGFNAFMNADSFLGAVVIGRLAVVGEGAV